MLNRANRFNIFCFLDNSGYQQGSPAFECILAAGCKRSISLNPGTAFSALRNFYDENPGWLFGHFGYALKNEAENLSTSPPAFVDFGVGYFFEPELLIRIKNNEVFISSDVFNVHEIFDKIEKEQDSFSETIEQPYQIESCISRENYLERIKILQEHIHRGDCYEINYCQQFIAKEAVINPLAVFNKLMLLSPNPFAALYKLNDKFCICASPERYLKKTGNTVFSQPIKGTSKRNTENKESDEASKTALFNSAKERSENVMVVDLVRNDLSRICKEGTVKVQELFGVYSFPQVHQMISTITGELAAGIHWTDVIKASFPMGSMTGAPKKRVMELIDQYETDARGLFSGAIGYINPAADFDFNVVIRSVFYDAALKRLSFSAGGGITFYSEAEAEYDESMLKAAAIRNVLG